MSFEQTADNALSLVFVNITSTSCNR